MRFRGGGTGVAGRRGVVPLHCWKFLMKFICFLTEKIMQIKKIALAALAAVSFAPAFAAVNVSTAPELVFMAWNSKGTFAKDLGVGLSSLTGVNSFNFAGSKWNDFLAFGGTDTQWSLVEINIVDETGFDPGSINFTAAVTDTNFTVINQRSNEGTLVLAYNKFAEMNIAGGKVANHEIAAAVGTFGDVNGEWSTFGGAVPTALTVGQTGSFVRSSTSSDDGGQATDLTIFSTQAGFTGTTLTVTAVPEPTTYAMLMAGLLAVGFVARRRQG